MAMDIRQLRYFIAVAEEQHITRAAERLGMQQPPLSQQIKAIERELNVQLFRRLPRGVELTEAGHALLEDARAILSRLQQALETTRRAGRGQQGRLCIGIAPTASFHPFVPQVIRAFREAFPLVSLTLEEGLSNEVRERFAHDQMDIAFVRASTIHADNLVASPLLEEAVVVALPSDHAMAAKPSTALPLSRLAGESFILYGPPGTVLHDETVAACRAAGFSPRIGQQTPRITFTLGLVAAGLGVALVPESMQSVKMDGLVYRRLKGASQPKAVLSLVSRRGDSSPVVRHFLNHVRRAAKVQPTR
jgi:DNA-binding transcriptional LysR family regulator